MKISVWSRDTGDTGEEISESSVIWSNAKQSNDKALIAVIYCEIKLFVLSVYDKHRLRFSGLSLTTLKYFYTNQQINGVFFNLKSS